MIYLDNAATTPVSQVALKAAWPWLTSEFGNASSHHELGFHAAQALKHARGVVADYLGCKASEIIFTSGGTESDNLGIIGLALANPRGRHVITSPTEHQAVLESVDFLKRIHGFSVSYLPVDQHGRVSVDSLKDQLRSDTTLVSIMYGNNEIGTVQPIADLVQVTHEAGGLFHCDAVQAVGWAAIDVKTLGIDAMSISGHKIHAPKGVGALFVNDRVGVEPLLHGGGQEFGRRSGTENVAWAVALAEALGEIDTNQISRVVSLRDSFIEQVLNNIPQAKLTGHPEQRLPHIASFVFEGVSGESILVALEEKGIICSSGSACAAGSDEPSHVLMAIGISSDLAKSAVRFSLSHATSDDDLNRTFEVLADFLR